ncbi:MAG: CoA synthetase [Alphaproteobacteria bacterium]|nr:CoA synthetase [Alphaproteobacteria bacterium]
MAFSREEQLICVIARMLEGQRNISVGTNSPIPAAAALLMERLTDGWARPLLLGSSRHYPANDGGVEFHDRAAQGRVDVFFLGGGQIDGEGNINLVGIGAYPKMKVRLPGSFGSAFLYLTVPRVILFREEHSARVLVPKVDFISAAGWSPPGVFRRGGPYALITSMAVFFYDKDRHRFRLDYVHAGNSVDDVRANTGFDFDLASPVRETPPPEPDRLALIRGEIAAELAHLYPKFAAEKLGYTAAAANV